MNAVNAALATVSRTDLFNQNGKRGFMIFQEAIKFPFHVNNLK